MNTQPNLGLSFTYDEPTDKPLMKTLLKLRNMGLIEVEWVPGDIRYTSENPFSVKKHLNVKITDPTVELDFPKVDEPLAWTGYDRTPFHSDFHSLWAPPSLWASPLPRALHHWSNVCPHCLQQGIWGHIKHHSIDDNDMDTDTACFVGCQECVKRNQWTWGTVKINDTPIDLPCNGAHSPIEYPVIIPVSERIGEWWRELSDGRWTGHGCWGQENMNRELVRSTLSQVVIGSTWSFTQDDIVNERPIWNSVFVQVPQRVVDLLLRTTGLYRVQSPGNMSIQPGEPDEVCIQLESNYCDQIPKSAELESEEAAEHIRNIYEANGIDTLPLGEYGEYGEYDDYDEDDYPELDSEADTKRKECVSKGFALLEEVMGEGKLDEGKYLELCNVFRDIHQN